MLTECVRRDPQRSTSYSALGMLYKIIGEYAKANTTWEEAVRLDPNEFLNFWFLATNYRNADERAKCAHWAGIAVPMIERRLKLHPDHEGRRVMHAILLSLSGRRDEALAAAMKLTDLKDGSALHNTACLFVDLGDKLEALRTSRKSIEAGFRNIPLLQKFLTDDEDGVLSLQGTPEYEEIKLIVEKLKAEAVQRSTNQKANSNA
jgi:tetratricopeptide (TPR) repeat protein